MEVKKLTPGVLVNYLRENQNNNKTLKALFSTHFLGKLTDAELNGLKKSIEKEEFKRAEEKVSEMKNALEKMGYAVSKK